MGDDWRIKPSYRGHRFPPEIISHAVWLDHRFTLRFRDIKDLLAERGITVSYESIRYWCKKFGPAYARKLRKKQGRLGDIGHVDELFVTIRGQRFYLWRAVGQDGDVIDILVINPLASRNARCGDSNQWLKLNGSQKRNARDTSDDPGRALGDLIDPIPPGKSLTISCNDIE